MTSQGRRAGSRPPVDTFPPESHLQDTRPSVHVSRDFSEGAGGGEISKREEPLTREEDQLSLCVLAQEVRGQEDAERPSRGRYGLSGDEDLSRERPRRGATGLGVLGGLREETRHQFIIWDVLPETGGAGGIPALSLAE